MKMKKVFFSLIMLVVVALLGAPSLNGQTRQLELNKKKITNRDVRKIRARTSRKLVSTVATLEPRDLSLWSGDLNHPFFTGVSAIFSHVIVKNGLETMAAQNLLPIQVSGYNQDKRIGTVKLNLAHDRSGSRKFQIAIILDSRSCGGKIEISPWASSDPSLKSVMSYERSRSMVLNSKIFTLNDSNANPGMTNANDPHRLHWTIWDRTSESQHLTTDIIIKKIVLKEYHY